MVLRMPSPSRSKNGVYYYSVRVPSDVAKEVGRTRIKESLRTKDPVVAKEAFANRHQQSLTEWAALRSEIVGLNYQQTVALTGERYKFWKDRFQGEPGPAHEYQNLLDMMSGVGGDQTRLETWLGPATDKLLLEQGLRLDASSRLRLMQEILRTDQQVIVNLKKNAEGDYSPDPAANRFPDWSEIRPGQQPIEASGAVTLSDLFSIWEREHRADGKRLETIEDFRQKVDDFAAFLGHEEAAKATTREIVEWCDELRHEKGLAPRTVANKYLAAVRAIYKLGRLKQRISEDPTQGIKIRVPKKVRSRPAGFTDNEATKILQSALLDPDTLGRMSPQNKLAVKWVPWICAFTGARGGEAAQLRKEDLLHDYGIPHLRLTPEAGAIKTGVYRLVPIHPQLVEIGLVEFINAAPSGHLFFTLRDAEDDPRRRAANAYDKVRLWVRKTVGLTDSRLQPNHAWRHRFKTLCRDRAISEEYSDRITGHEDGRAGGDYGETSIRALYREISKLPRYQID